MACTLAPFPAACDAERDQAVRSIRQARRLRAPRARGDAGAPRGSSACPGCATSASRASRSCPRAYEPAARRLTVAARDRRGAWRWPAPARSRRPPAGPTIRSRASTGATLVNYEQGDAWRRPRPEARVRAAGAWASRSARATALVAPRHQRLRRPDLGQDRDPRRPASTRSTSRSCAACALFDRATRRPLDSLRLFTWPGPYRCCPRTATATRATTARWRSASSMDGATRRRGCRRQRQRHFYFYALGPSDWATDFDDPAQPDTDVPQPSLRDAATSTTSRGDRLAAGDDEPLPGPPQRIGDRRTRRSVHAAGRRRRRSPTWPGAMHYEQDTRSTGRTPPRIRSTPVLGEVVLAEPQRRARRFPDVGATCLDADTT